MPYTLQRLAHGSFDLIRDGQVIGGVARWHSACGMAEGWLVELQHMVGPLPSPFEQGRHEFRMLEGVTRWLGGAGVVEES